MRLAMEDQNQQRQGPATNVPARYMTLASRIRIISGAVACIVSSTFQFLKTIAFLFSTVVPPVPCAADSVPPSPHASMVIVRAWGEGNGVTGRMHVHFDFVLLILVSCTRCSRLYH